MRRGPIWLQVAVLIAIAGGFIGEYAARRIGVLPSGWVWSMSAYTLAAVVTFVVVLFSLTKSGR